MYSNALKTTSSMYANNMSPLQTALSDLGPYCLIDRLSRVLSSDDQAANNCYKGRDKG